MLFINQHALSRRSGGPKLAPQRSSRSARIAIKAAMFLWVFALVLYVIGWTGYALPLPHWLRWIGVVVMFVCLPLSSWIHATQNAHSLKKRNLEDSDPFIHDGPWRFVRHPARAVLFLTAVGTCLVSASAFVLAATALVAVALAWRIHNEESALVERFGDLYREYQRETKILVPRLL